jgi:superfamily I DNA/RNA helicase
MKIAAEFVSANVENSDPDGLQIIRPNPDTALRSGPRPEMLVATNMESELRIAVGRIVGWLQRGFRPSEIAVLYRANIKGWVGTLASLISQKASVYWPHSNSDKFSDPSGVCVGTIHSAKGLQWRAVLVVRTDMMPFIPESSPDTEEQERLERGLMYVAMTRAEEMLAFTRSSSNGFASRIQQLLDRTL